MFDKYNNVNGLWIPTKPYLLWNAIRSRCRAGGSVQLRSTTYEGCYMSENFKDFQFFAGWCELQIGYNVVDELGRPFEIDKDLLIKGNKSYSEDTCVFLPRQVNNFLRTMQGKRGLYPLGVSFEKASGKYVATCTLLSKTRKKLGRFDSALSAHLAYKRCKEALAKDLALKYNSIIDVRAVKSLQEFIVDLTD